MKKGISPGSSVCLIDHRSLQPPPCWPVTLSLRICYLLGSIAKDERDPHNTANGMCDFQFPTHWEVGAYKNRLCPCLLSLHETGPLGYVPTIGILGYYYWGTHGDKANITHALQTLPSECFWSLWNTMQDLTSSLLQWISTCTPMHGIQGPESVPLDHRELLIGLWTECLPQNTHVETLISNLIVFGGNGSIRAKSL